MLQSFAGLIFILGLCMMTLVIWMPYLWAPVGYNLRRSEGPWLTNFDHTKRNKVIARDLLYTIGIWFGLFFIRISLNTPFFWAIAIVGMASIFGSAFISDNLEKYNKSTPAIMLFSNIQLSSKELLQFLASIGVFIPGKQQPYVGRMSYSNGYMWIGNPTTSFTKVRKEIVKRSPAERTQFEEYYTKLRAHLGADVYTVLSLSILQTRDVQTGERAVMDFIRCFSQHYPCIVEDAYGNILTSKDVQEAINNNRLILGFQKRIEEESASKQARKQK